MKSEDCRSSYLKNLFVTERRKEIVKRLIEKIKESQIQFDSIVFRGMSGALIVPEISAKLNKPMIMVRKKDDSHSCFDTEGYDKPKQYIVIDDLIYRGDTIRRIDEKMTMRFFEHGNPICVGIFLYHSEWASVDKFQIGPKSPEIPVYSFIIKDPPQVINQVINL